VPRGLPLIFGRSLLIEVLGKRCSLLNFLTGLEILFLKGAWYFNFTGKRCWVKPLGIFWFEKGKGRSLTLVKRTGDFFGKSLRLTYSLGAHTIWGGLIKLGEGAPGFLPLLLIFYKAGLKPPFGWHPLGNFYTGGGS